MTLYFIGGLGADKRIFQKLRLPADVVIKYIEWIDPIKDETLANYCRRIAGQIDTSAPYTIAGVSFGGMVAVELGKFMQPASTIIISSCATCKEMPAIYSILNKLKIPWLLPSKINRVGEFFVLWSFDVKEPEEKQLLREILADTSPVFMKWAIDKILTWQNMERPQSVFHIHGKIDKVFPAKNVHANVMIDNGGHFMVYNKADEISKILTERII